MINFDPNNVSQEGANIFGLPFTEEMSAIHILPVNWEVTTSYRTGTALAPSEIFDASQQLDLFDPLHIDAWKRGYFFLPQSTSLQQKNKQYRVLAEQIINALSQGKSISDDPQLSKTLDHINQACIDMNTYVYTKTIDIHHLGKRSILLGGDHSTPFAHVKALANFHQDIGILVIDAHLDMREAYESFTFSHASIMYNLLQQLPTISQISLVGIRDYCEAEKQFAEEQKKRVQVFYNEDIKKQLFEGTTWKVIVDNIVHSLVQDNIYISVDIDGLQAAFCPNTGTPVPGGLDIDQLFYLLEALYASGKNIIGADLCEVGHSKDEWDANVGARVLYKLCNILSDCPIT